MDGIFIEFLDAGILLLNVDENAWPTLDVGLDRLPLSDGSIWDGLWAHAYDDAEYIGSFYWAI